MKWNENRGSADRWQCHEPPFCSTSISAHLFRLMNASSSMSSRYLFFSLFLSLSADVFDLGRIWIRYLSLSPPKRLAFTFISNLVLAVRIFFFFYKASSKPCDPLLLIASLLGFWFVKNTWGTRWKHGKDFSILDSWYLFTSTDERERVVKTSQVSYSCGVFLMWYLEIYTNTQLPGQGPLEIVWCYWITLKKFIFIYLTVLGLSGSMWDQVPRPGIKSGPPALGAAWRLSHWTTREVPGLHFEDSFILLLKT